MFKLSAAAIFAAVLIAGCAPSNFQGRLILEGESPEQMAQDARCQSAWDIRPGQHAIACSWAFPDGLNGNRPGCHIVFEQPGGADGIVTELANCGGVDQKIMRRP